MTVCQKEEYYIFILISSIKLTDTLRAKLRAYLIQNDLLDFEFQDGALVVDGLECEHASEKHNQDLKRIIEKAS